MKPVVLEWQNNCPTRKAKIYQIRTRIRIRKFQFGCPFASKNDLATLSASEFHGSRYFPLMNRTVLPVLLDLHPLQTFLDGKRVRLRWIKRHGQTDSILGAVLLDSPILTTMCNRLLSTCVDKESDQVGPHVVATLENISMQHIARGRSVSW